MTHSPITVVAGCPRSGTSMMMAMLAAGGLEPYCDPEDYGAGYEAHEVTGLPDDHAWLVGCAGKAVKLLDPHRFTPPAGYPYRVIWMERDIREQAVSHVRFLRAGGFRLLRRTASMPTLRARLRRDVERGQAIMRALDPGMLVVRFEDVLADPYTAAARVAAHVGSTAAEAMAAVVWARGPKALLVPAEAQVLR